MSESLAALVEMGHQLGWSFTPLRGKRPTALGWQRAERETLDEALAWAETGNVGLRTGRASGVVVVDIDPGADLSKLACALPETVEVQTGRGGRHLYYACDRPCPNSAGRLAVHVDVRGDGGQVVYPGSTHPETGTVYEFTRPPDTTEIARLPDWILEAHTVKTRRRRPPPPPPQPRRYAQRALQFETAAVRRAAEGERNDALNRAAFSLGQLVGGDALDRGAVEGELSAAAGAVGLGEGEALATIRSGIESGMSEPRRPPPPRRPSVSVGPPYTANSAKDAELPVPVLVPGPHVDADGVYHEQSNPAFTEAVFDRLPDDAIYRKGHLPGEVVGPAGARRFNPLRTDAGRLLIDRHMRLAAWYAAKRKTQPDSPDRVLVYKPCGRDHASLVIAAAEASDRIRDLELLVSYPAYAPGFERLRPGWQGGIYYDEPPELKDLKPDMDIESIRGVLEELIIDFPFKDEASRQNFFGLMLTPLVAPAVEGNRPLHLLLSPLERTGKTKLAEDVFGGSILGRPTPAIQITRYEDEQDKRLLALLLEGETLVHFDNLPVRVASAALSSALTATAYQGRVLGASKTVSLMNSLTVVGSGNNTECSGEIAKRAVPILLAPQTSHPELRDNFHHPDLRAHVRTNRRRILAALLGMIETWRYNDMPRGTSRMGGFEAWSETIGGIMRCSGFTLWRSNVTDWVRQADPRGLEVETFVATWADVHGTQALTASTLVDVAEEANVFGAEMEKRTTRGRCTVMGKILRRLMNRPVGDWVVRRREGKRLSYFLEAKR